MKFIFTLCIIHFYQIVLAQTPTLDWVKSQTGSGYEYGTGIAVDNQGNSYSIGSFRSITDFDPSSQNYSLTPIGTEDIYILKLDNLGNFVWAIQLGGLGTNSSSDDDNPFQLVISPNNEIVVTGQFGGSADFDPSPSQFILNSNGLSDVFIAKYSFQGSLIWAKSIGGTNIDSGKSVCVSNSGAIYISGQSFGSIDYDPNSGDYIIPPNLPYSNGSNSASVSLFTLKLSQNGDFIWANILDDYSDEIGYIVCDEYDNLYQVGRYGGIIDADPGSTLTPLIGSSTYYSTFLRKLDPNGNLLWAKTISCSVNNTEPLSICYDQHSGIIITGYFQGTMDADPGNGVNNLVSNGSTDVFVIKFNILGDFIFANSFGGNAPGLETGVSVATDEYRNIYVLGYLESQGSTVDFDMSPSFSGLVDDNGTFLVKYDSLGNFDWVIRVEKSDNLNQIFYFWNSSNSGGGASAGGSCLFVKNGSIYINGSFSQNVDFDPTSGVSNLSTNGNQTDSFVHKLNFCGISSLIIDTTVCGSYIAPNGIEYTESGVYNFQTNFNCVTNYTLNLQVNQLPITPIVYLNLIDGIIYTQSQNNVDYQWYFCSDNILMQGEINDTLSPSISSLYYVTVTNQCGTDTSDCVVYEDVGIGELDKNEHIVFPNPTEGTLNLPIYLKNLNYHVCNSQGQILFSGTIPENGKIDLIDFQSGLYYLKFDTNFFPIIKY